MITGKLITKHNIFDCNSLEPFFASIIQRMPYVGASDSRFYLCSIGGTQFLTKMCLKFKSVREIYRPNTPSAAKYIANIDAEIIILKQFKTNLINTNVTPHIIELIYDKKCSTAKIVNDLKCLEQGAKITARSTIADEIIRDLCRHRSLVSKGLAQPELYWIVLEHGNISLATLMEKSYISPINTAAIKVILFHVIYTLYAIKCIYPEFRHNDLHGENIVLLVDPLFNIDDGLKDLYVCKRLNAKFAVPYYGIVTKIIDFGNSELPELGIISQSSGNALVMHDRFANDMIILLHWVYVHMVLHNGSEAIEDLLKKLEPNQTYIKYDTTYIQQVTDKIPGYDHMLLSEVFANYRVEDIKGIKIRKCYNIS